jgi:outer membrane cobalamin receptor
VHSLLLAACCLVGGNVHSPGGAPIARALLVFQGPARTRTLSDPRGNFSVHVPPGRYDLTASARGFATVIVNTGTIAKDSTIEVVLEPADSPKLRTIGSVTVNGATALVRDVIPTFDVSRAQMDAIGYTDVTGALQQIPSLIVARPDAGAPTAPSVVSLRGPDPSEALVTLDGQPLNDANTGDVDLSQFPVAAFSSVSVTQGLGPTDTEGSNTFGGAVNLVTLRPTQQPHVNLSGSFGSYGTTESWLNATGTVGRLGYAFAGSDFQQAGQTNQYALVYPQNNVTPQNCVNPPPGAVSQNCPSLVHLGSTISARLADANLDYHFSQRADAGVRLFTLGDVRDESSALDGIAGDVYQPGTATPNPVYSQHIGPGSATLGQSIRAYNAYSQSVLGAGSLIANVFASDDNVDFAGAGVSPYDVAHLDKRYNESLSWQRTFEESDFAFGGYLRQESLAANGVAGTLSQSIGSVFVRGSQEVSRRLRLLAGLFDAHYSTFGSSLDWRLGASYDLGSSSSLHASAGTGFRAPLLIERYYFPPVTVDGKVEPNPGLPPPDQNCVVTGQGNPNERPEHATEYELGFSHVFSADASFDASFYRSNLRDTIENDYPIGNFCHNPKYPDGFVYSYPINIGNAVYQGAELRFTQLFPLQHLTLRLQYGLNVAYPYGLGATVSNPTSGGALVDGQQFLGVPQQQGAASLEWAQAGWHAATAGTFAGRNDTLNQSPYTLIDASAGRTFGRLDVTFAATNVFNAVSGPFTSYEAGVPYRGVVGLNPQQQPLYGSIPTDRLFVQPASIRMIFTLHE